MSTGDGIALAAMWTAIAVIGSQVPIVGLVGVVFAAFTTLYAIAFWGTGPKP